MARRKPGKRIFGKAERQWLERIRKSAPHETIIRLRIGGLFENRETGRRVFIRAGEFLVQSQWVRVKAIKGRKVRPGKYTKQIAG